MAGNHQHSVSATHRENSACSLEQPAELTPDNKPGSCGHSHPSLEAYADKRGLNPLVVVLLLNGFYVGLEIAGAYLTGSMALLADAFHMVSDVASIALAVLAAWWASKPAATPQRTFGNHRAEVLAGFLNGLGLIGVALWIIWEASQRLEAPHAILAGPMFWVALGGLLINCISAWWLHKPAQGGNLNIQGAYLHVLGDLLGSVGAVGAAILVDRLGWLWADPAVSLLIALLLIKSAWHLVKEAGIILLEWCPEHLSIPKIEAALMEQTGVRSVHDLHVWGIGSNQWAMSAHVVVEDGYVSSDQVRALYRVLRDQFGLKHQTIQLETQADREQYPADGFTGLSN